MKCVLLVLRYVMAVAMLSAASLSAAAQELNCKVEIDYSQVAGTNTAVGRSGAAVMSKKFTRDQKVTR